MPLSGILKIATLRGPSAVEMAWIMDKAGKDAPFGVEVFDEPAHVLGRLAEGSLDFAVLPSSMAAVLCARGIDYREAATVIWGGLYVCGTDRTVKSLGGLKGKTIHVLAKSSPPELMLSHLLRKAGVDPCGDVFFDHSFPTHKALSDAVAEGKCGLCILSEPFLSMALKKNDNLSVLLDLGEEWRRAEGTLPKVASLFCRGSLLDDCQSAVNEVIAAFRESCGWVKSHPDEASIIVKDLGIFTDSEAVRTSVSRSGFEVVSVND